MSSLPRRTFLAAGAGTTLGAASAASASAAKAYLDPSGDRHVYFTGDGVPLNIVQVNTGIAVALASRD